MKGFKDFLLRGNVVELAVAVVIGAAFTALVSSFTSSFLTPLIGLLGGGGDAGGTATVNGQVFTWGGLYRRNHHLRSDRGGDLFRGRAAHEEDR